MTEADANLYATLSPESFKYLTLETQIEFNKFVAKTIEPLDPAPPPTRRSLFQTWGDR